MVRSGYWKARHASGIDDARRVYKTALEVVKRLPPPWRRSRRGRPPQKSAHEYAAICIVMVCFDLTYREVESFAPGFAGKTIDHSMVGWALKRMSLSYLGLVLGLTRKRLRGELEFDFYFVDSTGISTPRKVTRVEAMRRVRRREVYKVLVLAGYSGRAGALVVVSSRVTKSNASDCAEFPGLMRGIQGRGEPMLGDSAFDALRNYECAERRGFIPVFRPREGSFRGLRRREILKRFRRNRRLYRRRGIGEALFGGIENRYGARTRCRRVKTKRAWVLLALIAHNLRTLMRIEAMRQLGIFCFTVDLSDKPEYGTCYKYNNFLSRRLPPQEDSFRIHFLAQDLNLLFRRRLCLGSPRNIELEPRVLLHLFGRYPRVVRGQIGALGALIEAQYSECGYHSRRTAPRQPSAPSTFGAVDPARARDVIDALRKSAFLVDGYDDGPLRQTRDIAGSPAAGETHLWSVIVPYTCRVDVSVGVHLRAAQKPHVDESALQDR
jgi:hypothetical protein